MIKYTMLVLFPIFYQNTCLPTAFFTKITWANVLNENSKNESIKLFDVIKIPNEKKIPRENP